jgi:hypothetical protein
VTVSIGRYRKLRFAVWLAASLSINAIAFLATRIVHRPAVAFGCAFDVAVTVPALYYWLVVRAGVLPAASMIPLCLMALLRATFVAPGVAWARPALGAGAELAVTTYLVVRVRRGLRAAAGETDIVERLTLAARELLGVPGAAAIVASELAVLWYALGPWGRKPHIPERARPFTIHQQTITAALFWALAGLSAVEAIVVHVVLRHWSRGLAWSITGLSGYATVWMVAVARSLALRPILLSDGELTVRCGILWSLRVPRSEIARVRRGEADGLFHLPPASQANVVLEFLRPVTARSLYGLKRQVNGVALALDDPEGFLSANTNG